MHSDATSANVIRAAVNRTQKSLPSKAKGGGKDKDREKKAKTYKAKAETTKPQTSKASSQPKDRPPKPSLIVVERQKKKKSQGVQSPRSEEFHIYGTSTHNKPPVDLSKLQ